MRSPQVKVALLKSPAFRRNGPDLVALCAGHWLGLAHRKCCLCVDTVVDSEGSSRGKPSIMVRTTGNLTGIFSVPLHSTHRATELYFSMQVQGAAPSWFLGLLFLRGKLDMGINGINYRPHGCNWSWGVNGAYPNPSMISFLNYLHPQAITSASPCGYVASISVTKASSFVCPPCQFGVSWGWRLTSVVLSTWLFSASYVVDSFWGALICDKKNSRFSGLPW